MHCKTLDVVLDDKLTISDDHVTHHFRTQRLLPVWRFVSGANYSSSLTKRLSFTLYICQYCSPAYGNSISRGLSIKNRTNKNATIRFLRTQVLLSGVWAYREKPHVLPSSMQDTNFLNDPQGYWVQQKSLSTFGRAFNSGKWLPCAQHASIHSTCRSITLEFGRTSFSCFGPYLRNDLAVVSIFLDPKLSVIMSKTKHISIQSSLIFAKKIAVGKIIKCSLNKGELFIIHFNGWFCEPSQLFIVSRWTSVVRTPPTSWF